jgi:hypothetical protein
MADDAQYQDFVAMTQLIQHFIRTTGINKAKTSSSAIWLPQMASALTFIFQGRKGKKY